MKTGVRNPIVLAALPAILIFSASAVARTPKRRKPVPKPNPTPSQMVSPTATPEPSMTPTMTPSPGATSEAIGIGPVEPGPMPEITPFPNSQAIPLAAAANPTTSPIPIPIPMGNLSLDLPGGAELTLEKSIQIAVDGATQVLKASNDLEFSGTRLLQAYGQFLPSIVGQGNYQYNRGRTYSAVATPIFVDGRSRNAAYSVTADLNLFNGLADFANLKSSILKKDASDLTLKRARQEIALDVAQTYLQVVLDEKLVQISMQNLQASQERERLLKEQTDVGVKNLADLFRQQAQTSQDESSLLSAQNKRRADQIALLRKLRVEVDRNYHFAEPEFSARAVAPAAASEADLVNEALRRRYDLKASKATYEASDWDIHTAAATYMPRLDLFGTVNSVGHTLLDQTVNGVNVVTGPQDTIRDQLGRQVNYAVGLNLTWSLFDRFITAQNVSRAKLAANNAKVDADDRKFQVEGEVRQAYSGYVTAVQQLRSSKKGLEAAQKAYEVMDGRYGVGAASFLDLVTTQTALVQAESTRAQAVLNYELQVRSLGVAVGDDEVPKVLR